MYFKGENIKKHETLRPCRCQFILAKEPPMVGVADFSHCLFLLESCCLKEQSERNPAESLLLYSQTKGVKRGYLQFISH